LGFSPSDAARVSVAANVGGIIGGAALGYAADWLGLKRLVIIAFAGMAVATALFGQTPANMPLLIAVAAASGFFMFGGMIGFYAVLARTFPPRLRATGTGLVVGVGRASSAAAPAIAGFLLVAGMDRGTVSLGMAIPALFAAIVLLFLPLRDISAEG
jgi:MFS family permease